MIQMRSVVALAALSLLGASALWSTSVQAQCVSVNALDAANTQNFDTLAQAGTNIAWTNNATIPGWHSTRATYNAGTGSSNAGALYSFGVAGAGVVGDRALGGIASNGTGVFYWAACFVNNTGSPLQSVDLAFVGEQWRDGGAATPVAQALDVEYQFAAAGTITGANTPTTGWTLIPALQFNSPTFANTGAGALLDGNAAANRQARSTNLPVAVPVGAEFWIRWIDANNSGNDHALAIDDFSFTARGAAAVGDADLSIVMADSPDPVTAGTNISYLITMTNTGPDAAQNARFSVPLPAGTTLVSTAPSAGGVCTAVSPIVCTWAGATANAAVRTATIVVAVAANVAEGSFLDSSATAASDTPDPDPADNLSTVSTSVVTSANLAITVTDTPDPVIAGNQLTYAVTVSNAGPSDAQGVSFSLPLATGTSFASVAASAGSICNAASPVTCTWAGATAPGVNRTATIVVNVAANVADGTQLLVAGTATSTTNDPALGNNTGEANTTVNANANLAITLSDSPDPVIAGTNLTYVATLTNAGPSDAQGANITLPLPAGTSFVSAAASVGGSCSGANPVVCTWAGATTTATTRTATIVVLVSAAQLANLSATATAASATTDPTPGNNTATQTTTVNTSADLAITLVDSPDPVIAGTNLTYTATLSNAGPSDAQGANIVLPLAAGTSLVSATPSAGGACSGTTTVTCTWSGATAPGLNRTATIIVLVSSGQTANLSATATAASTTNDPNPGNNSATANTVVEVQADLSVTLTDAPDPVIAGTNLTYTAVITNIGPSDATGVVLTLPTPSNTSFVSGSVTGGGTCGGSPVVCTVTGSMLPATSRTVSIVMLVAASAPEGSTISATATVTATSPDPNLANNTASTTTSVITRADLLLGFSSSVAQTLINVPVTFTATSLNQGPSDAQGVSVTITLTPDFRYSSFVATGATCTTPQVGTTGAIVCTWAGATAPGVTRTLTVVAFSNVEGRTAVNASTTSNTVDPVTSNNSGSLTVQVGYLIEEIPTLSGYGLILLGLMFGLIGFVAVRRQV